MDEDTSREAKLAKERFIDEQIRRIAHEHERQVIARFWEKAERDVLDGDDRDEQRE